MKVDKFTKIVLAIIALNLTFISLRQLEILPKVFANEQAPLQELYSSLNYGLVPLNEDGSITVKLSSYDEIDVNITDISTYDKLNVAIKDIDTYDKFNVNISDIDYSAFLGITVPVKIENQPVKVENY